jgi:hypothetical protein
MKNTVLITCGCSWTYGAGVGYQPGMSVDDYKQIFSNDDICNSDSFRGILSRQYGFENINLSHCGSSNQRQFRVIKKFFSTDRYNQLVDSGSTIIVLHGITSTARNELYLVGKNQFANVCYDGRNFKEWARWARPFVKYFYDHNNEVARLAEEMIFMNQFYQAKGIKNLWFDTFNHHDYPCAINNLIRQEEHNRDLLSTLSTLNGLEQTDGKYHQSVWKEDTNRLEVLVRNNYLNPISYHPTRQGHEAIADIIKQDLERII